MSDLPIWRIPNTTWTIRGAADLFVAEHFGVERRIENFNDEDFTFNLVGGNATYTIIATDKWINVFRQKEK